MPLVSGGKVHRCDGRRLTLVAEVYAKRAAVQGWVEALGARRIRSKLRKVEIFCRKRETSRFIYYERRVFWAEALAIGPPDGAPIASVRSERKQALEASNTTN